MIVRWRRVDVRSEKCQIIYPLKMSAFRVVIDHTHDPRVARSSQPWALLRNPFGIPPEKIAHDARISVEVPGNALIS